MIKTAFLNVITILIMIIKLYSTQTETFEHKDANFSKILLYSRDSQEYIIVAGKNNLMKFSTENLNVPLETRTTGPVNDSILCTEPNRCSFSMLCTPELSAQHKCIPKLTDVYVKSWTITQSSLVVCYNVYQGYCEMVDLYNNFTKKPLGRGYSMVTYDLNSHSTISHYGNKLYVAIEINALLNVQSIDFYTISIRTLPNMKIISSEFDIFSPYFGRLGGGAKTIFPLEFKGSFYIHDQRKNVETSDYIFFLVNQPENKIEPKNGKFQMRLVRLCAQDEDFSSFMDIGLNCEIDRVQTYYQIDSWSLAQVSDDLAKWYRNKTVIPGIKKELESNFNQILYLNLKTIEITNNYKETLKSLVTCAYPIAEIMEIFEITKTKCMKGEGSVNEKPYDINSNDTPCSEDDTHPSRGYCSSKVINRHIIGEHIGPESIRGHRIINKHGFRGSSLIVFQIYEKYNMAVTGGTDGVLYKFELFEDKYKELDSQKLFPGGEFSIQLNDNNDTVYAVSNSKIAVHKLNDCGNLTHCEKCLRMNPFCGWCISSGKCTVRNECIFTLWIPYERTNGNNSCPEIKSLPSHSILEYSNNIPIINFQIIKTPESLFSRNSQFLRCQFAMYNNIHIITVKAEYYSHNSSVSCNGPPKNNLPVIRESENFVNLKLKLLINESFLMEEDYFIYNCAQSKTCSRCTENRFNCTWCVLNNLCVPAYASKCKRNMEVLSNSSYDCPKLEAPQTTLAFHNNSQIVVDLPVKFKNYFGVKTEFFCSETCDNTSVKALYYQSTSTLRCVFKKPHQLLNGIIKCLISVYWKLQNSFRGSFESDRPIEFQVFECSNLSQHCDDCILLPSIYQCGFCSSNNRCVPKIKCDYEKWIYQKDDTCPSPEITQIIPENSTLFSETVVLIKGRNLGFYEKDIQNAISLENAHIRISCKFIDQNFISAKQFMCKLQNVTNTVTTPLLFQFIFRSKQYLAKAKFYFFTPYVYSVIPNAGPLFGGTVIKIIGNYLNIGSKREIYFKYQSSNVLCEILENLNKSIYCRLNNFVLNRKKRSLDGYKAILQLSIDQHVISYNNISFHFFPDIQVKKISRNKLLSEGGQLLIFHGNRLELINKPCLAFYCNKTLSNYEECLVNDSQIYCITPKGINVSKPQECQLRFGMEKGSVSIYNGTVTIFPPPGFKKIPGKINLPSISYSFIKKKSMNDKILMSFEMKSLNFLNIFIVSDFSILIGTLNCTNITLSGQFISCNILIDQIDIYQTYSVNIKIGRNFVLFLGDMRFEKGDISLDSFSVIILTIIVIIVLIILIVIIVCVVKKSQNKQQHKKKYFGDTNIKEQMDLTKKALAELNQVAIQDDIHKNWNTAPIHPYNVYILYNLFPNTHPRLCKENKNMTESIFNLNYYNYDSNDPTTHPLISNKQIQVIEETFEYSRKLSKLFEDELFVLVFFSFLEEDDEVDSKKSDIVSFLSLILMKDMLNYTKILKLLIKSHYDSKKSNNEEQSLFRQSDLLSKLLSNWFFILMYDHLQNINAGGDLLILYLNMLELINNGPVNFVTNKCQRTLNENSLLDRHYADEKLKINVKYELQGSQCVLEICVLECDCIPQVKLKIWEKIHKYTPYSKWYRNIDEYDLAKCDRDATQENENLINSKILKELDENMYKTLKQYEIKNGDTLELVQKSDCMSGSNSASVCHSLQIESNNASLKTNRSRNININSTKNLLPETNKKIPVHNLGDIDNEETESSNFICCQKTKTNISKDGGNVKHLCLIYTQVLKTGIDTQIKNVFDDIFDIDSVPPYVTDLFTYFNNICKDENVVFAVKSNSLILRFWIQLINNIDFLFDIPLVRHTPVLECLKCISRVLMDICSEKQNKDAWLTQLFSDMIKIYSPKVLNYYEGIKNSSNFNLNDFYSSSRIDGINISLAIVVLYQKYIKQIHDKLVKNIQNSNNPKNKQIEWINILLEVNNLYTPERFLSEEINDENTTTC